MVPGASHLTCYPPDSLPLSPSLTPLLSIVNIQQIGLLLTGHFARSMLFFFLSFFVLVIISIIILFLKEKKKRTRYKIKYTFTDLQTTPAFAILILCCS